MVQISWFYGIKISMHYDERLPPHFHVEYGDYHAVVDIQKAVIIKGELPKKQASLVIAWTLLHQDELMDNWHNAYHKKELFKMILSGKEVNRMIPPALIQVYADKTDDYTIICQFVDGKVTKYHMRDKLTGVFEPLKNKDLFKNALTILDNTAAWDLTGKRDASECLTVDPWQLYNAEDITCATLSRG